MAFCGNCGTNIQSSDLYCGECGYTQDVVQQITPQQGMPQQGMPQQGIPQQGIPQQGMPQQGMFQQEAPQQGMPQQGMPQQETPQITNKKSSSLKLILVLILCLGLVGGSFYYLFGREVEGTVEEIVEIQNVEIPEEIVDTEDTFIGRTGTYTTVGATLNIKIDGDVVTSEVMVANYQEKLIGKVVSATEAEVYLESGELIRYVWIDENKVLATPVDQFSQESINMIRVVCEALNENVYTYESDEISEVNSNFISIYLPTKSYYTNSNDGGFPNTYSINITAVDNNNFTFTLVEEINASGNWSDKVLISDGVAVFNEAEDYYAYYKDSEYELRLDCSYSGSIVILGYEPIIQLSSVFFMPPN